MIEIQEREKLLSELRNETKGLQENCKTQQADTKIRLEEMEKELDNLCQLERNLIKTYDEKILVAETNINIIKHK